MSNHSEFVPVTSEMTSEDLVLLPVLARIFDVGRGPPALTGWVRHRLGEWNAPVVSIPGHRSRSILIRLARELSKLLKIDDQKGTTEGQFAQTLLSLVPSAATTTR